MAQCPRAQCYHPFTLHPGTSPASSGSQFLYLREGQHRGNPCALQRQPPGLPRVWVPTPNLMGSGMVSSPWSSWLLLSQTCGLPRRTRKCWPGPCPGDLLWPSLLRAVLQHLCWSLGFLWGRAPSLRMSRTCPNGMESRQRIRSLPSGLTCVGVPRVLS